MAATVYLSESNGPSETVTDNISVLNYGSQDIAQLDPTSYRVTCGLCSVLKEIRVRCSSLGGSTSVSGLMVWMSSGVMLEGESLLSICNSSDKRYASGWGLTYIVPHPYQGQEPLKTMISDSHLRLGLSAPSGENLWIGGDWGGSFTSPGYSNYWCSADNSSLLTPAGLYSTTHGGSPRVFTVSYNES